MPQPAQQPPPRPEIDNRRNHYRVLHVQPEAPLEVIKASYRTIMTRLKGHPDLGGSHAHAAMINEAWQVLGDPVRRAAYDKQLRRRGPPPPRAAAGFTAGTAAGAPSAKRPGTGAGFQPFQAGSAAAPPAAPPGAAAARPAPPPPGAPGTAPGAASAAAAGAATGAASGAAQGAARGAAPGAAQGGAQGAARGAAPGSAPGSAPGAAAGAAAKAAAPSSAHQAAAPAAAPATALSLPPLVLPAHHCPLCGQVSLADPRPDSRCLRCHAPLATLPAPGSPGHELLGRRGAARREQQHVAMLRVGWPSPELPVRWRDLSLTGLSLFAPQPLRVGQRIHVLDQALEAVAEVIVSRPQGRLFTVHARLVSALLLQSTGVFVSAQA